MNFALGIPTINRYDLLRYALERYLYDFPSMEVIVVDNGNQDIAKFNNMTIINHGRNLGVAGSWNLLCKKIFEKHDYAIILNDDVYWGKNEDEVEAFLQTDKHGFYSSKKEWCIFIIDKKTFEKTGDFDEAFYPAYYEDNDYSYRMSINGTDIVKTDFLDPEIFRSSASIQKNKFLNENYMKNRELFVQKWGGLPGKETFKKPFNQ